MELSFIDHNISMKHKIKSTQSCKDKLGGKFDRQGKTLRSNKNCLKLVICGKIYARVGLSVVRWTTERAVICRSQGVDLLLLVNVNKLITLNTGIHDVSACGSSLLSVLLSREIHPLACLCPEATSRAVFWLCADKSKSEIQLTHLAMVVTNCHTQTHVYGRTTGNS